MFLDSIVADKKPEVEARKEAIPLEDMKERAYRAAPPLDFKYAITHKPGEHHVHVIAEVKKASPSKGLLRSEFDPVSLATIYQENGASAISVLTDEKYFQGSLDHLQAVREVADIPLLRKDFIIDEYQIYEARAAGADAILLIAAILPAKKIKEFRLLARKLGMASIVEVHAIDEMLSAIDAEADIIGINNRDLKTFDVSLYTTQELADMAPEGCVLISESGISTYNDVLTVKDAGVDAILVGECLVTERDPSAKLKELLGK